MNLISWVILVVVLSAMGGALSIIILSGGKKNGCHDSCGGCSLKEHCGKKR